MDIPEASLQQGCPFDCGLCPRHLQHTCTAVLDVTSCLTLPKERGLIFLPGNIPGSAGDLLKTALSKTGVEGIVPGIIHDFNETPDSLPIKGCG